MYIICIFFPQSLINVKVTQIDIAILHATRPKFTLCSKEKNKMYQVKYTSNINTHAKHCKKKNPFCFARNILLKENFYKILSSLLRLPQGILSLFYFDLHKYTYSIYWFNIPTSFLFNGKFGNSHKSKSDHHFFLLLVIIV